MIIDDSILLDGYAARFIVSQDDPMYVMTDSSISASAMLFLPDENPTSGVLETSVFLHKNKDDIPWIEGGRAFKALKRDGSLGKRPALVADIACSDIRKEGLDIIPDDQGGMLPHHANIRAWDINDAALKAARLAAESEIHPNPSRRDKFAQKVSEIMSARQKDKKEQSL